MSVEFKDPISSYRIDGHTHCIADEMVELGIGEYKKCGSSDAMSTWVAEFEGGEEKYSSYCFSCAQSFQQYHLAKSSLGGEFGLCSEGGQVAKKVFERKPKSPRITMEQAKLVISYGTDATLKHGVNRGKQIRGIKEEYNAFFGHRTRKDANGNPLVRYYPETCGGELNGYKTRTFPKGFGYENLGITGISNDLSGQHKFKDMQFRDICICPGEEDKVAFFQQFDEYQKSRFGKDDKGYAPMPVVSPTTGEGSAAKQLRAQYDFVNRAERIFIGMDNDSRGRQAAEEIAKIFPKDKVFIISWSYKDPNNAINNPEGKDYSAQTIRDFYNAKPYMKGLVKSSKGLMSDISEVLLKKRITLPDYMSKISKMMGGDSGEEGMLQSVILNIIGNTSCGKCHGINTPVLMHDMSIKMIQDIKLGDVVMGDDGGPRNVTDLSRGRDTLYCIDQRDGMSYTVNSKHPLSLRAGYDTINQAMGRRSSVDYKKGEVVNMSVPEYLQLPSSARRSLKGYKGVLTKLDNGMKIKTPWLVGMWLGDGDSNASRITQSHSALEAIEGIYKEATSVGYGVSKVATNDSTTRYSIIGGFRNYLDANNLLNNKHIPTEWLCTNWEDRVELLSGLLDSDGHYTRSGCYEITQKRKVLAEGIVTLCRSLGLRCSITEVYKSSQYGTVGMYYRMFISGDTSILNLRLTYKQPEPISEKMKLKNTAISVTELGVGDYYGISVDGNHLYCLQDFTVTHNTTHVNGMCYHWIMNSPQKPIVASLEATSGQYALDIISIHLGENIRKGRTGKEVLEYLETPEVQLRLKDLWENEYGEERFRIIDERDGNIKTLERDLEEAFHRDGCEMFIIDVLTDILRNLSIEQQSEHMSWQKNMVKKGATIVNVLHTTKPKKDKDGNYVPISEYDAYGSSTFVQSASINILIDRDKMTEDNIEKNTTRVRMPKCREGYTGEAGEWYYDTTTRKVYDRDLFFKENPHLLPSGYELGKKDENNSPANKFDNRPKTQDNTIKMAVAPLVMTPKALPEFKE